MTGWSTPPFDSLTKTSDPRYRLVNCIVMDEEVYRVECWMRRDGPGDYWRPTSAGRIAYAELRDGRKEDRKSEWQARIDGEDEYSDSIVQMIERSQR